MNDSFLMQLVGRWAGTCKTWFEPAMLADESEIQGEFVGLLGGQFFRHTYSGQIRVKPRAGEELLSFHSLGNRFQIAWIDDFHTQGAILFSEGESTESGFSVFGEYEVGKGHPPWGWRTEYRIDSPNQLTILAYNVEPGGAEARALETIYVRSEV